MATLYVTGTCRNCMMRFRFDAREVARLTDFFCPHCKSGVDGIKIRVLAQGVLRRLNKK